MSKESAPEVKNSRIKKTAAIVFMTVATPIAIAGIDYSNNLMRERKTQLQEQGIIKPTPDQYKKAVKTNLTCKKKAQDILFISKEKPHCDQAQRTIFEYKAHNTVGLELPVMFMSVGLIGLAGIVGWNTFIAKEPT